MYSKLLEMLLLQIPSTIVGLYVAIYIQQRNVPLWVVARYGGLLGASIILFRIFPVSFALHVPFVTIAMFLMVRFITGGRWSMALLGTLVVQLLGAAGEGLITVPVFLHAGLTPRETLANPLQLAAGGWLSNIPMLVLLVGLWFYRRHAREAAVRR